MKVYLRKTMLITAIILAGILCLTLALMILNMFDFRYWVTAKTGWFYPEAQALENISDVEQIWEVSIPEGSYIENKVIKKDYQDMMYIKYKPYVYEARIVIPKEKTEEFVDHVRRRYTDTTIDGFGNKDQITFPEFMSDFQDTEFSFAFWRFDNAPTGTNSSHARIPMYRSIYIFEEEDKTTVYLSV